MLVALANRLPDVSSERANPAAWSRHLSWIMARRVRMVKRDPHCFGELACDQHDRILRAAYARVTCGIAVISRNP